MLTLAPGPPISWPMIAVACIGDPAATSAPGTGLSGVTPNEASLPMVRRTLDNVYAVNASTPHTNTPRSPELPPEVITRYRPSR